MEPEHGQNPQQRMEASVEKILGETLGALPWIIEKHWLQQKFLRLSPFLTSFLVGLVMVILFYQLPKTLFNVADPELLNLCFWAAMFFFLSSWSARVLTQKLKRAIGFDFAHLLDDTCKTKIADTLAEGYRPTTASAIALAVALAGTWITSWALRRDLSGDFDNPAAFSAEIYFALFTMFLVYFISARATFNARFYLVFSQVVRDNFSGVFRFEPKQALLIQSLTTMARNMLLFWIGITFMIATLPMMFFNYPLFSLIVVPTTLFFSLGLGSVQFLAAEKNIREAVHRSALQALVPIEAELAKIQSGIPKGDASREEYLWAQRKRITQNGRYGSVIFIALSAAAPFLGPLVGYIASGQELWGFVSELSSLPDLLAETARD